MSDKMIAIIDKPKNCQNCVWGICKYSTPLSTNRKGYYCQLKEPKERKVEDFAYEDEVHLNDCPLVSSEEHDREIRNKAIDSFMIAIETLVKLHGAVVLSEIQEIAEKMKEVGE